MDNMDSEDDFSPNHTSVTGLALEMDLEDTMLDISDSSSRTMSTIESDQVADYFRSFHGFQYQSDESVPRFLPLNTTFDKIDIVVHLMFRVARGWTNVPSVVDEMLRSGGVDGDGGTPRVLEVITNSGVWVQEMAETYPSVSLVSMDTKPLVPHKPHARIKYEVYDLHEGIMAPDSSFDLVYTKNTERATKDVNQLLQEFHRVLKPNGYLVIDVLPAKTYQGDNPNVPPRHTEGMQILRGVWEQLGIDISMWDDLGSRLDVAHPHWGNNRTQMSSPQVGTPNPIRGFHSINFQKETIPLGVWSTSERDKILGGLSRAFTEMLWRNFLPTMLMINTDEEEAKAFIERALQELEDIEKYQVTQKCQLWYARKI